MNKLRKTDDVARECTCGDGDEIGMQGALDDLGRCLIIGAALCVLAFGLFIWGIY